MQNNRYNNFLESIFQVPYQYWSWEFEAKSNVVNTNKIISDFYQKYWGCHARDIFNSNNDEADLQDCSFSISPEQKIRNQQEFVRSEEIEKMKLPKHKMYDLLLSPYLHERIIELDEQNLKVKYFYRCKYGEWNRLFTKGWNILDHVRMHEDLRPYQCEFCSRAFTQKCNLTKHRQIHLVTDLSERKKFKWRIWEKSFTERYNLKVRI